MTVGELLDHLTTQPRDRLVVLAKDNDGNGYSPLDTAEAARYIADSTWSGELSEHDGVPVVLLNPVN